MKISNEMAHEMVVYLRGLASGEVLPRCRENGLCGNFRGKFGVSIQSLVRLQDFPEYSGDESFPIKSPNKKRDPLEEYYKVDNLWTGRYGASRKRFCTWCADQIENDYL